MYEKEVKRKIKESKRIIPEDELYGPDSAKLKEWKDSVKQYEKGESPIPTRYKYKGLVDRYEHIEGYNHHPLFYREDIALNHDISFIKEVIPKMLDAKEKRARREKKPPDKLRVLDLGGGLGLYAEQLRKKFKDHIKVVTTGLSRRPVWEFRRRALAINKESARLNQKVFNTPLSLIEEKNPYFDGKLNTQMHPDDLLKRSILEFKDFEEFDLIIDTVGEAVYSAKHNSSNLKNYLDAVIKKLKPGGMASINRIGFALRYSQMTEKELDEFLEERGVKFEKISATEVDQTFKAPGINLEEMPTAKESDFSEILRIYK